MLPKKIIIDISVSEWSQNEFVQNNFSYSIIKKGFWHAPLKLPITYNLNICSTLHKIYSIRKYLKTFNDTNIYQALDYCVAGGGRKKRLENGLLFTGDTIHYHYLIHGLINLTSDMFDDYEKIYVDKDFTYDQIKFLSDYILILTGKNIKIECIKKNVLYELLNCGVPHNISDNMTEKLNSFRKKLFNISPKYAEFKNSIVYVSRKNAKYRRVLNESQLIETIQKKFDVICVSNENMSLFDQFIFYSNKEIILGASGGGLANLIFARTPKLLMEFTIPPAVKFFSVITKSLSVSHKEILCQVPFLSPKIKRINNNDMVVPIDLVIEYLSNYIKKK